MAFADKVSGYREPRGTGPYNGHPLSCGCVFRRKVALSLGSLAIGHVTLQIPDGHGLALLAQDAFTLALDLLGTNPAADSWQTVGFPNVPDGFGKFSLGYEIDETRDVDPHRATLSACGVLALETAFGLLNGFILLIAQRHFKEIPPSNLSRLFGHFVSGDFFLLFRHVIPPY
jgi:hypothetical protein